jgi:Glycosyltransferase family 88
MWQYTEVQTAIKKEQKMFNQHQINFIEFLQKQPNPRGFEAQYYFNIKNYYKIWFSDNPDSFLGIENELRFINMRENNPLATLSFIYSSKCLNHVALNSLRRFCNKYNINYVDFDTDIPLLLKEEQDIQIYKIAESEINNTLKNEGGNLAAASDCVRLLVPVIEKFGIYSDFDVTCKLSTLEADVIAIQAPVLLNAEIVFPGRNKRLIPSPGSDFLAFAHDVNNMSELTTVALLAIRYLQKKLINNYQNVFINSSFSYGLENSPFKKESNILVCEFMREYPEEQNIFSFRKYISNLQIPNDNLKVFLYHISVVAMSGPSIYTAIYTQHCPKKLDFDANHIIDYDHTWNNYLTLFRKSSVCFYDTIAKLVISKNTVSVYINNCKAKDRSKTRDNSWSIAGKVSKNEREAKLIRGTIALQNLWRCHHARKISALPENLVEDYSTNICQI